MLPSPLQSTLLWLQLYHNRSDIKRTHKIKNHHFLWIMFIQKKRSLYMSTATFSGAPDWIRTSGLPGRSRTLYPTELRTHIYENRPKTDFSYLVVSGQIVVRLLQNRRMQCRKMALLCGFSAAPGGVSELSEPNALSN